MDGGGNGLTAVWVAIALLGALVGGCVTAFCVWEHGRDVIAALGAGGCAFLGLATLGVGIVALFR